MEFRIVTDPKDAARIRIEYQVVSRSPSSEKLRGTYHSDMTKAEVEAAVRGPFGGHFESFGGGRFVYVAFTD